MNKTVQAATTTQQAPKTSFQIQSRESGSRLLFEVGDEGQTQLELQVSSAQASQQPVLKSLFIGDVSIVGHCPDGSYSTHFCTPGNNGSSPISGIPFNISKHFP